MVNLLNDDVVAYIVDLAHRSAFVDHWSQMNDFSADEFVDLFVEASDIHPFDIINCIVWNICDIIHHSNCICIVLFKDANRM